jgi:hypothetical protein
VADSRRRTLKRRTATVKSETASPPSRTHHHFPSSLPFSSRKPSLFLFCFPPNPVAFKCFPNGNFFSIFSILFCPLAPHGLSLLEMTPRSRPNRRFLFRASVQLLPLDLVSPPGCLGHAIASICTIVATAGETVPGNFGSLSDGHDSLSFPLIPPIAPH